MSLGFYFNTKHMCIVIVNNVKLQESSRKIQTCFFKIGWHPFCEFYLLPYKIEVLICLGVVAIFCLFVYLVCMDKCFSNGSSNCSN